MKNCSNISTQLNNFYSDLFKSTILAKPNESFVYSPLGISIALTMAFLGASNNTKNETKKKMLLQNFSDNQIIDCFKIFLYNFCSAGAKNLNILNNIYVDNHVTLNEKYLNKTNSLNYDYVQTINFNDYEEAAEAINNYVANKTNNNILNAIDSSSIEPNTLIILLNLINFEANWEYKFNINETTNASFAIDDNHKTTLEMMKQKNVFKFKELNNSLLIQLPYSSNNFGNNINCSTCNTCEKDMYLTNKNNFIMYIILPNEPFNLNNVITNFTYESISDILEFNSSYEQLCVLQMPKFNNSNTLDVIDIVKVLGINQLFDNNLKEMSNQPFLKISKMLQKAFIKVTESGTEASAFTESEMSFRSFIRPCKKFLNRPFMYVIADQNQNILFNGVFRGT